MARSAVCFIESIFHWHSDHLIQVKEFDNQRPYSACPYGSDVIHKEMWTFYGMN